MSETPRSIPDGLAGLIGSAIDDLTTGHLDGPLPTLDQAETDRERELIGRLRETIVSRRRAALKLRHVAAAIDSAVSEVRDRMGVAASSNAEVTAAALACDASATSLGDSARRVGAQTNELQNLIDSAAQATTTLAETGREATGHSDDLSAAVGEIATVAATIASSMREIDRAIGGLAEDISTTSNAVNAINQSIRSIDAGASETSALSAQMSDAAANGIDVVRQTAEAVAAVNSAIGGLGRSMEQLVARSEEVSEITKIIQAIAVQAKLLALNASIQAAHAGEAGRGFAVVAREIKQLSDSTTASTREIETLVRSILTEIAFAREEAHASSQRAERGLTLANSASIALDAIYAEAELIRSRVQKISDATSTQTMETANLQRAVGRVAELAEQLRTTAADRISSSHKVVGRVREISDLALRVRAAMAEQEDSGLGIVTIIESLMSVAGELETAVARQTSATDELATAIGHIYEAGQSGNASVAAMAYSTGLLEQHVTALRDEVAQVRLPAPVRGGGVVVPLPLRNATFDPVYGFSENHASVLVCVFETLVESREEGSIAPCLAERWEVSADGLVWTFELRRDVRFHHGRELVADDVVYSLERLAREGESSAFVLASVRGVSEFRAGLAPHIAGISAPASHVVTIELVEPIAFLLGLLALSLASIVPRDVVEPDAYGFGRKPVGTGPYRVEEVRDDRAILTRFDDYRIPDRAHLDTVEFDLSATTEEALDGVLDGRFAFTKYVPRARLPELIASAEWRSRVLSITQPHCHYLLFNALPGRLSDPRLRRAIAHAVDRSEIVRRYSEAPIAVVAEGLIPPTCPGYDPSLRGLAYDPDLARRLVDESGYDRSRPLDLVLTRSAWSLGDDSVASLAEQLGRIGLRVVARSVDDLNEARRSLEFDLLEAAWYADYLDPDTFTFGVFHSRLGALHGNFEDDGLDVLFEQARATTDPSRRAALYRAIHVAFQELCPAIVLLHRRDYIVHSPRVEGVQLYALLPTVRPPDIWVHSTNHR